MKNYFELDGVRYEITDRSMKSKKNQFNTPSNVERRPYQRKDRVTFELIVMCLLAASAWGAFVFGIIKLMG